MFVNKENKMSITRDELQKDVALVYGLVPNSVNGDWSALDEYLKNTPNNWELGLARLRWTNSFKSKLPSWGPLLDRVEALIQNDPLASKEKYPPTYGLHK